MKKVWKLTAIGLLALTLTVGHAFLYSPVKADAADPTVANSQTRILFSFIDNAPDPNNQNELYLFCDVIFTSNALTSGQIYFEYDTAGLLYSFGPKEGYGPYNVNSNTTYTKNNSTYRKIVIDFANTSYFVYRFVLRATEIFWTTAKLQNPVSTLHITFGSQNLTYGDVVYSDMYQYNMMNYYLESIANGQASVVSAMQSVDGTLQDILDEVQQINQSLNNQQQQQVDNLDTNSSSLNNAVDNFGDMEDLMNQQFDISITQFQSKSNEDSQSISTMMGRWNNEMLAIKDVFESFIMMPQYLFFLVIPLVMVVLRRIMGN